MPPLSRLSKLKWTKSKRRQRSKEPRQLHGSLRLTKVGSKEAKGRSHHLRNEIWGCTKPSGPLNIPQRAAGKEADTPDSKQLVQHNGIGLPFQPKKKFKLEEQFKHFLNMFCKVHTNFPLINALQEIPRYAKLLMETVMRKQKLKKSDLKLPLHCSEIIQKAKGFEAERSRPIHH